MSFMPSFEAPSDLNIHTPRQLAGYISPHKQCTMLGLSNHLRNRKVGRVRILVRMFVLL
jgi:hypothetical protein